MKNLRGFVPLAALAAFLFAGPSMASASKPPEIASTFQAQTPYGEGTLRVLFLPIYDAALWTDAGHWSMQTPFALSLNYHRGFSTDEIVSRSLEEMKNVDPALNDAMIAHYRALLTPLFPAVNSGDEFTGLYTPDGTVRFFRDGQLTGEVHDAGFAQAFFGIWLSPRTSEPSLRAKLLKTNS